MLVFIYSTLSLSRHEWSDFIGLQPKRIFLYHMRRQSKYCVIRNPSCDTKKLYHTALLPVQLVHRLEHVVVL